MILLQNIHALLKMTCLTCHRFRSDEHVKKLFLVQNELLDKGLIIAAQQVYCIRILSWKRKILSLVTFPTNIDKL